MGIEINVSMTNRPRDVSFPLHDATYVIYRAFRRIGRPSRMRTSNIITEVDYCVPCILIFWHLLRMFSHTIVGHSDAEDHKHPPLMHPSFRV